MTASKNPKLRFKDENGVDFPDWQVWKIGDLYKTYNGLSGKSAEHFGEGDPFITYKQIFDDSEIDTSKFGKVVVSPEEKQNKVFYGDILVTTSSETPEEVGFASVFLNKSTIPYLNSFSFGLHSISTHLTYPFFSKYLFRSKTYRKEVIKLAQGSTRYNISKNEFLKISLSLPAYIEQEKIAEFLTSVDNYIQNLNSQKEELEKYKKAVIQKIFSQQLRFKDSNGKNFPDWDNKKIGDICEYRNGGSFESKVTEGGKYNLITLNSIDIEGNLKKIHKTINEADWFLKKGDLVMVLSDVAHGNFLGLSDIISESNKYVLNQRMGLLRKTDDNVNLYFLKNYINFNQHYFKKKGQGSSQQNLSKKDIENFSIKIPILSEQKKIAEFLSSIDLLVVNKGKQIKFAEEWKKGLMQQMFV